MLTNRMINTMSLILREEGYITIKEIAEQLNVSSRTLLREVDSLGQWVENNHGEFIKKKGSGLKVSGDRLEKERLLKLLRESESDVIFTPEQRGIIIRANLLGSDEPLKLYTLASKLDVAESTVSGDLLAAQDWFEGYGISLIKRQGLGVYLKGDEKSKRRGIVSLLYEQLPISDFMEIIREDITSDAHLVSEIQRRINKNIFELLEIETIRDTAMMIEDIGKAVGFSYADNAFMILTLRFCVTLRRKELWGQQLLSYEYRDVLRKDSVFKIFRQWIKGHQDSIISNMPEEELLYLTMHMKGSKLRDSKRDSKISMIEDFRTIQLAKEFVIAVEKETGVYLSDNEELVFGLVKHLRPAIYRMRMELDFINPLMVEIKSMYPKLFLAVRKCASLIEEKEKVQVSDDEIAYLATHIGAIIQKEDRQIIKKFQVVLACMHGIGASQLLRANIEKNFRNIDVVNVISVMDYKMNKMDFSGVDLVVSTIAMDTGETPCIVVNPVFKQEDVIEISSFIKRFTPIKKGNHWQSTVHLKEKLRQLSEYGDIMTRIIDNFDYDHEVKVMDMAGVIEYASGSIAGSIEEKGRLVKAFGLREEKGSTILSKKGMMLLHCRADISNHISLKMFKIQDHIEIKQLDGDQKITTIVVMVGPLKINEMVLNVLSEVSRSIITSEFASMILSGDDQSVEYELHKILDRYYQKLTTTL